MDRPMKLQGKKEKQRFVLPTTFSEPMTELSDFSIWLYGPPKHGKTTLCQQFDSMLHLMFEPGYKALRLKFRKPKKWEHVDRWIDVIEADDEFKNVSVDTVEAMYDLCWKAILKKLDIEHPSDLGYGKGWDAVRSPFIKALKRLLNLEHKGCVLVSHANKGTRTTKDGDEIEDIHPNLSGRILEEVAGAVDVIAYYHVRRGEHTLQIRPSDDVMAGCRLEENFNYTDGSPIKFIPMGSSKQEAYENLLAAFNNELERPEERRKQHKLKKRR
jgi:hypothetical protein